MTFKTTIAALVLVATAGAASASGLASNAGVEPGVYSNGTLVAIIDAKQNDDHSRVAQLLKKTIDNTRVSTRGDVAPDFDALIAGAQEDNEYARAFSLASKAASGNFGDGVVTDEDIVALIALAEQDDEYALAAALNSRFN